MGIKERQKVARLIEEEFCARRREASKRPEDHEVVERAERVSKSLNLTKDIEALKKAEATVASLKNKMHAAIVKKYPEPKSRYRNADCKCTGDWWNALLEVAKEQIVAERGGDKKAEALYAEERRLVAALQTVATEKDLLAIIKKAGLA